ncbi:hypothetical protein Tco_1226691 [Tanacetum coccineum]
MQRTHLFEAIALKIWKNRFETIDVKSKDYREESKDLSTLPLDELIGNLKFYEVVLEKDLKASKIKNEKYKSLALKERKVSSDKEESCSGSNEEYAMAVRDFKKFFKRRGKFVRQSYDDKKNLRKSDSEEEDDSKKDEIALMALDNN